MRRGQGGRGAFPPADQVPVLALATSTPADSHCPATRWSVDDSVATLRTHTTSPVLSRSTLWRVLDAADLKPQRRVYWRNSHAPACAAQAQAICALSIQALRFSQDGRLELCPDATTGMQIRQRTYPTQLRPPGQPEKREQADMRHGTRVWLASFVVPTGQGVWHLSPPRTSADFATHLTPVVQPRPAMQRDDWVVETLKTHWRLELGRLVATWCALPFTPTTLERGVQRRAFLRDPTHQHVLHWPPNHGAWLTQVALWCGVLARHFLNRGDLCSIEDCASRLDVYVEGYNTHHAHPYRWTYTGQPLIRATPWSQTRRQQRQGRAWFSPRPQRFERAFYPPRPDKRATIPLGMNL